MTHRKLVYRHTLFCRPLSAESSLPRNFPNARPVGYALFLTTTTNLATMAVRPPKCRVYSQEILNNSLQRQSRPRASAPRSAPVQSRSASTAAAPSAFGSRAPPAPPANVPHTSSASQSGTQQPGMLAQMAATAGSVAVGSTIGHGLSSMLFGGGGHAAAPEAAQPQSTPVQQQQSGISCEVQAKGTLLCSGCVSMVIDIILLQTLLNAWRRLTSRRAPGISSSSRP